MIRKLLCIILSVLLLAVQFPPGTLASAAAVPDDSNADHFFYLKVNGQYVPALMSDDTVMVPLEWFCEQMNLTYSTGDISKFVETLKSNYYVNTFMDMLDKSGIALKTNTRFYKINKFDPKYGGPVDITYTMYPDSTIVMLNSPYLGSYTFDMGASLTEVTTEDGVECYIPFLMAVRIFNPIETPYLFSNDGLILFPLEITQLDMMHMDFDRLKGENPLIDHELQNKWGTAGLFGMEFADTLQSFLFSSDVYMSTLENGVGMASSLYSFNPVGYFNYASELARSYADKLDPLENETKLMLLQICTQDADEIAALDSTYETLDTSLDIDTVLPEITVKVDNGPWEEYLNDMLKYDNEITIDEFIQKHKDYHTLKRMDKLIDINGLSSLALRSIAVSAELSKVQDEYAQSMKTYLVEAEKQNKQFGTELPECMHVMQGQIDGYTSSENKVYRNVLAILSDSDNMETLASAGLSKLADEGVIDTVSSSAVSEFFLAKTLGDVSYKAARWGLDMVSAGSISYKDAFMTCICCSEFQDNATLTRKEFLKHIPDSWETISLDTYRDLEMIRLKSYYVMEKNSLSLYEQKMKQINDPFLGRNQDKEKWQGIYQSKQERTKSQTEELGYFIWLLRNAEPGLNEQYLSGCQELCAEDHASLLESNACYNRVEAEVLSEETNSPVANASLRYTAKADKSTVYDHVTAADGHPLADTGYLPFGTYELSVTAPGYDDYVYSTPVEVGLGSVTLDSILLVKAEAYSWALEPSVEAEDIIVYNIEETGYDHSIFNDLAYIEQNGKYGIIDYEGKFLADCTSESYLITAPYLEQLSAGGITVGSGNGDFIKYDEPGGVGGGYEYYFYSKKDSAVYDCTGIDGQGNYFKHDEFDPEELHPVRLAEFNELENSEYELVEESIGTEWGIAKGNKLVVECEYDAVALPCSRTQKDNFVNCDICALRKDGKWCYVDGNGNELTDFDYSGFVAMPPADTSTNFVLWGEEKELPYLPTEGSIAVKTDAGAGYIDTSGNVVIEPGTFTEARPVHNGLAWVKDKETGLWGIIQLEESGDKKPNSDLDNLKDDMFSNGNFESIDPDNNDNEEAIKNKLFDTTNKVPIKYYYDTFEKDGTYGIIAIYQYESNRSEKDNCQVWYSNGQLIEKLFEFENISGTLSYCNVLDSFIYNDASGRPYVFLSTWQRVAMSWNSGKIFGLSDNGTIDMIFEVSGDISVEEEKIFVHEYYPQSPGLIVPESSNYEISIVDGAVIKKCSEDLKNEYVKENTVSDPGN